MSPPRSPTGMCVCVESSVSVCAARGKGKGLVAELLAFACSQAAWVGAGGESSQGGVSFVRSQPPVSSASLSHTTVSIHSYRRFQLGPYRLVARTELHGYVARGKVRAWMCMIMCRRVRCVGL